MLSNIHDQLWGFRHESIDMPSIPHGLDLLRFIYYLFNLKLSDFSGNNKRLDNNDNKDHENNDKKNDTNGYHKK